VNSRLGRIWKGETVAMSRYYPDICLEKLSKTMKYFNVLAEIFTENFPNSSLEHYTNVLVSQCHVIL
jgi:hypothetical protein